MEAKEYTIKGNLVKLYHLNMIKRLYRVRSAGLNTLSRLALRIAPKKFQVVRRGSGK